MEGLSTLYFVTEAAGVTLVRSRDMTAFHCVASDAGARLGSPTWLAWGLDGGGGGAELCCWKMDSRAPRAVAGHEDAGDAVAAVILHQHHAGQIHWGPGGVQTWDNWGA